jgi:hypothetical protein
MPKLFGSICPKRKRFASHGHPENSEREFENPYGIKQRRIAQSENVAMAIHLRDKEPETIFSFRFAWHRYDNSS